MADNAFVRALKEAVDRVALNNQGYDFKSGQWNGQGVKEGAMQRGAGVLGTIFGGPLGGIGATKAAHALMNRDSAAGPYADSYHYPNQSSKTQQPQQPPAPTSMAGVPLKDFGYAMLPQYGAPARGGCVAVDSALPTHDRADAVQVGDALTVMEPADPEHYTATVSHSETIIRPCVRIETDAGVVLECSEDAEIANVAGDRVLAKDLLGELVPVEVDGKFGIDAVSRVERIGDKAVQKITCEDKWFPAGKERGRYLLHHNTKAAPGKSLEARTTDDAWNTGGYGRFSNSFGSGALPGITYFK